jgi:hypothetical protein
MHEILVCGGSRGGDHIYIYWLIVVCFAFATLPFYTLCFLFHVVV